MEDLNLNYLDTLALPIIPHEADLPTRQLPIRLPYPAPEGAYETPATQDRAPKAARPRASISDIIFNVALLLLALASLSFLLAMGAIIWYTVQFFQGF